MSDKIECFYEKYGKGIKKPKDKTITQHHILIEFSNEFIEEKEQ